MKWQSEDGVWSMHGYIFALCHVLIRFIQFTINLEKFDAGLSASAHLFDKTWLT